MQNRKTVSQLRKMAPSIKRSTKFPKKTVSQLRSQIIWK